MKQGFMRTVEAMIAIFITFLFIIYYYPTHSTTEAGQPNLNLLPVLEKNDLFRSCIIQMNSTCINSTITAILPAGYDYIINISEDPNARVEGLPDKRIYADSVYMAGNETDYKPQIIRLYYWSKG